MEEEMEFGKFGTDREERINYDRMRKYRVGRVREMMKEYGWGTLVTWDDVNIRYLTGARLPMGQETGCVVFPVNGNPYLYRAGVPLSSLRKNMPWLKGNIRAGTRPRPCDYVTKEDCQSIVKEVAGIMAEHGLSNKPLGIDGTTGGMFLKAAFEDAGIKTAYDIRVMGEARKVKNQDELDCMRMACAIDDAFFTAIKDALKPGITEQELLGVGLEARYRLGSDGIHSIPIASGQKANPPYLGPSHRVIQEGELVFLDAHGAFNGYETCYYHTFCCGKASAEQKEIYAEARDIVYDGLNAVKAGNTALDVVEKWPSDPRRLGAENWHEIEFLCGGHGIGLGLGRGDYAQRFHHGIPKEQLAEIVFEENMTLAIETWNGRPGGKDGVFIEEDIIVTKDGHERLSKFPFDDLTECGI